jgi:hypothetical protein
MCTDRSCYDGNCEKCHKIDRLCEWPYGYENQKPTIKTAEQKDKLNKFMIIQIKKTKEMGRNFYKER